MSLVESYAAERRARLRRLGAIPTNSIVSKLTEATIARKPRPEIVIPPVEFFYPSFWCWDLVTCHNKLAATIRTIQEVVASEFNISVKDINSQRRNKEVLLPRKIALYLAVHLTMLSTTKVGILFGGRDHSTVVHSCAWIKGRMTMDDDLANKVNELMSRFE